MFSIFYLQCLVSILDQKLIYLPTNAIISNMLSLITAIARNGVIGQGNKLPWHLPADLKYFKKTTSGKTVLMGANTYNSIASYLGHGLPDRENIVLSNDPTFNPTDATVVRNLDEALDASAGKDTFVIGGRMVYQTFLPLVDRLYITWVEADIEGDVLFPDIDFADFSEISRVCYPQDAKNAYNLTFAIYERRPR